VCCGIDRENHSNTTGLDGIPLVFIKLLLTLILPVLTQLFYFIRIQSTFSFVWKIFKVIPIPKAYFPTNKIDYRPIFILPVLAKAFENVMFEQMADYVTRNNLISPFQSGFRPGYSRMTALVRVSNDIHSNFELNQPTIVVLHVFSKALIEYALD
jgi:hypothetical protein